MQATAHLLLYYRVRLAADKSMLVTVDGNGRASIWRLLDPDAVAFWAAMASHPNSLAHAARCVPAFELVLYGCVVCGSMWE